MSTELKEKEKELVKSIQSEDFGVVSDALQAIRKDGSCRILPQILELLRDNKDSIIQAKITEILFDLKEQDCASVLIDYLHEDSMKDLQNFLVAAFWQSSLDGSEYLSDFVKAAIHGNYLTCLEALTVIENFDATFTEEEIIESNADLDEAIEEEENQDKKSLLEAIKEVLNQLPLEEA